MDCVSDLTVPVAAAQSTMAATTARPKIKLIAATRLGARRRRRIWRLGWTASGTESWDRSQKVAWCLRIPQIPRRIIRNEGPVWAYLLSAG